MDITKNNVKLHTTKYINGETVNYSVCFWTVAFIFILIKQLLKAVFAVPAGISVGIGAGLCAAVLFIAEKKLVFHRFQKGNLAKQLLFYLFRCGVDFAFYKIFSYVFGTVLGLSSAFIFLASGIVFYVFNYYFDRLLVFDCTRNAQHCKGGRCFQLFWQHRFVIASMLLAALCIAFVYVVFQLFPFGDTTVLRMDLYHQYGPLFAELYDRVYDHKSFFYSWYAGGGTGFLGNYFNYLSSPLSFIVLLFDRKDMPFAITTMVAVKGILAAGAFTLYLKYSQKRHSFASAAFGVFYAFCAYFLAYYWNIMWIDGIILLPFIVLGIERIIDSGRPLCYIISLCILLFSSYYIGYMTCIFAVLYFLVYYFIHHGAGDKIDDNLVFEKRYTLKKVTNIKFVNRGLVFAGASLLAAALCAVTLLPVFFILQQSSATSDSFPKSFTSYFDILNLLTSHLAALETTIRSSGDDVLPNIYCGVLCVLLMPLYIANPKIRIREKSLYLLLILLLVFSFDNNWANFIWHAFHFPNDLPYRFSFIYSFVVLVVSFRSLMYLRYLKYKDIAFVGMFWLFVVIFMQKFQTNKMSEFTIYVNLALIIVWTAVLLLIQKGKLGKFVLGVTVFAVAFCEVIVADTNSYVFTQNYSNYTEHYDTYEEAISYVNELDGEDFYRTELTELDTRMDPSLYGYNGMSIFSSMAYEQYSRNQYSLGMFSNRINSYTYHTQTPVYNLMFSLKYLMQTEGSLAPSEDFYQLTGTTSDESVNIYRNRYHLPLAFTVKDTIEDWQIEEDNPFTAQAEFFEKATGSSDVFVPVKFTDTVTSQADCEPVTENGTYYFTKAPDVTVGDIDITLETVNDSNLYIYITAPKIDNVNYYWQDEQRSEYQNINEPYIIDLGKHQAGETVRISLDTGSAETESSYFEIYAYNIDKSVFEAGYEILNSGKLELNKWSETKLEGTVNAGYNGVLYTSIPYDDGWQIYIDGEQAETYMLTDAQLACDISEGEHQVVLRFVPRGLYYGIAVTAAAWLLCAGAGIYLLRRKRKKPSAFVENI